MHPGTLVVVAAFLLNLLHKIGTSAISEVLVEVPVGEAVTLMCQSNDENHNFFYWYLNEKNIIVGPSNTWLKITKVANLLRQQINYKNYHFIAQVNISKY
jgi:hypothetical protein